MLTMREMVIQARACTNKEEARELLRREVQSLIETHPFAASDAARVVLQNVSYALRQCPAAEHPRLLPIFGPFVFEAEAIL